MAPPTRYHLEGKTFGKLRVVSRAALSGKHSRWLCVCDCGMEKTIQQTHLLTGHSQSCGVCNGRDPKHKRDLTGERFGDLLVVGPSATDSKRRSFVCMAPCGHETIVQKTHLVSGHTRGCRQCRPLEEKHKQWTGCGEISGNFLYQIKNNAKTRGLTFTVTPEEIWDLFIKQGRKCALSGLDLSVRSYRKRAKGADVGFLRPTASLDRIESEKGYTPGNVQWVHKDINRMKQAFTEARLIELCKLVVKHQKQNARN